MKFPGQVEAEGIDTGAAWHYGSPVREQRALEAGTGLTILEQAEVVELTGPDRLTLLHNLSTQHVAQLAPGVSTELLVLSPTGHIEHAAFVYDDGDHTYLILDAGGATGIVDFLMKMKFMMRVEARQLDDVVVVGGCEGGLGSEILEPLLTWIDPWPDVVGDSVAYGPAAGDHPAAELARTWLAVIPADRAEKAVAAWLDAGGQLAGMWAWEARRIASYRPRFGTEVGERALPHELDWLRTAVHLEKGCYRGQETIARVVNLGRPPRRLVFLHLDGSDDRLPAVGSAVEAGGRTVGSLTSVARHMDDGPIGLALIKRNTPIDAELSVDGISATQVVICDPEGRTDRAYERPKLR